MKIDKNVPIPESQSGPGRPRKYPFPDMEVGDSFYAEGKKEAEKADVASKKYGTKYGCRFTCRRDEGGGRIWRIE